MGDVEDTEGDGGVRFLLHMSRSNMSALCFFTERALSLLHMHFSLPWHEARPRNAGWPGECIGGWRSPLMSRLRPPSARNEKRPPIRRYCGENYS